MTTPDELLRLAERVEQGSGQDRELAFAVWKGIGGAVEFILTSIDAVEERRLRMLPRSSVNMSGYEAFSAGVILRPLDRNSPIFDGNAGSESRARLAALLRAVAGKEVSQ